MSIKGIGNIIKKAGNSIGNAVNAGKQSVKKVTNSVKNKVSSVVNKTKNTIGDMVKTTKSVTQNIVNKAKNTVANVVKATKESGKKIKETIKEVKDKGAKKVGENILNKLKEQIGEIKENALVVRGKVITGGKGYLRQNVEGFVENIKEEGKKIYESREFNNLLKKGLNLGNKINNFAESTVNYLDKSFTQAIKGSYAGDETTLLGTVGEIGVGCIPVVGQIADVREIVYDVQNWEWTWGNVGDLALDVVGFVPAVGDGIKALKKVPFKEIGNGIEKGIKAIPDGWNSFKKGTKGFIDKITGKGGDKAAKEITEKGLKNASRATKKAFEEILSISENMVANITEQMKRIKDDLDVNLGIVNNGKGVKVDIEEVHTNNKIVKIGGDNQKLRKTDINEQIKGFDPAKAKNLQKGNYGEFLTELEMYEMGDLENIMLDSSRLKTINDPTHKGIDLIFKNNTPPPEIVIVESKFRTKANKPKMNKNTNNVQMDDDWIEDNLIKAVGDEKAQEIQKLLEQDIDNINLNGKEGVGNILKLASLIDQTGNVRYFEIGRNGEVLRELSKIEMEQILKN